MKRGFLKTFIVLGFLVVFLFNAKNIFAQNTEEYQPIKIIEPTALSVETSTSKNNTATQTNPGSVWDSIWNAGKTVVTSPTSLIPGVGLLNGVTGALTGKSAAELAKGSPSALSCTLNPLTCIISSGAWFSVQLTSLILYLSGAIFDIIINYTVLSSTLITSLDGSITIAWKIVRDLSNIIIVFSLLYLGIKTIIDGQGFADKKTLISVIIVAILINFSLVFTRAVFDVSNFIGAQIGEQIKFNGQTSTQSGITSISAGLVKMIRPASNMSFISDPSKDGWGQLWDKIQVAIFTNITILTVSAVLFGASFLLIYRFLIFVVLMIASPFGLVAKFLPWFKGMGDSWWKALKTQAIVLPAFLLTLYISVLFVSILSTGLANSSTGFVIGSISGGNLEQAANSFALFFFNFLLIIGFLILPLIVPGKIGAAGAGIMTSAGNWTMNKVRTMPQIAGRTAATGVAKTGRTLGGLVGDKVSNKESFKKLAQDPNAGTKGSLARFALRRAEGLKDASFDFRNTSLGKNLGLGAGIDGYSTAVKKKKEALLEKQKKEEKLFGFDKPIQTPEEKAAAKVNLEIAKAERDNKGAVLQKAETELKEAQAKLKAGNATEEQVKEIANKVIKAQDDLEKSEKDVGELMIKNQKGYVQIMENRQKRLFNSQRYSVTSKAALKAIQKDIEKDWKEKGKYKPKKQKEEKKPENKEPEKNNSTPSILGPDRRSARS
ncbi:MAG: hypothetical protein RLZZ517_491 [Candidatus Parcubacteria bacterium]|jgi:hypothetical protein